MKKPKKTVSNLIVAGKKGMGMTHFAIQIGDRSWYKEPQKELLIQMEYIKHNDENPGNKLPQV